MQQEERLRSCAALVFPVVVVVDDDHRNDELFQINRE